MATFELIALGLVAGWLAVLTVAILVLVRQVALLTYSAGSSERSIVDGGPPIGHTMPPAVAEAVPELKIVVGHLLFVSPTCGACLDIVRQLESFTWSQPLLPVVTGDDQMADDFIQMMPDGVRVIRDPDATTIYDELHIIGTPYVVEIDGGIISGTAYLRNVQDLRSLVEARGTSDAAEVAVQMREVNAHVS